MRTVCSLLILLIGLSVHAEDKKKTPPLSGSWTRTVGEYELSIIFQKDQTLLLKVRMDNGDGLDVIAKYTYEAKTLHGVVEKTMKIGGFPAEPSKGDKFSFKWEPQKETAELKDLEGDQTEGARPLLEGEWKKPKKDE